MGRPKGSKNKIATIPPDKIDLEIEELPKPETTGVVIIALGSPHYGNMAANLAASIRVADPLVNIHLVYSDSSITHLTDKHKALFSSMAACPYPLMSKNGKTNFIKAKTRIYELSPFDNTLMIDADVLLFARKSVSTLIRELMPLDFTMQSRGWYDFETGAKQESGYTWWCKPLEAKEAYGLTGKFYQLSSEVLWFKKNEHTKQLFELVKEIFDNPKVTCNTAFMGDLPDEIAYNIATCKLGFKPRQDVEVFMFWENMDDRRSAWNEKILKYYGLSAGGNSIGSNTMTKYSLMARSHSRALQLPYEFKIYPKRQWDATRKKL